MTEEELTRIIEEKVEMRFRKEFDAMMERVTGLIDSGINRKMRDMRNRTHLLRNATTTGVENAGPKTHHNFGMEDYQHLLIPYLTQLILKMNDMGTILQRIIIDLFFNPEKKINSNVYIPPNAYKSARVFTDNMWKNYDINPVLEGIVRRANDVLQHYIIGNDVDKNLLLQYIGKRKFDVLEKFTDSIDNMEEDTQFRRALLERTENTIVTNQHLVHPHIFDEKPT